MQLTSQQPRVGIGKRVLPGRRGDTIGPKMRAMQLINVVSRYRSVRSPLLFSFLMASRRIEIIIFAKKNLHAFFANTE